MAQTNCILDNIVMGGEGGIKQLFNQCAFDIFQLVFARVVGPQQLTIFYNYMDLRQNWKISTVHAIHRFREVEKPILMLK